MTVALSAAVAVVPVVVLMPAGAVVVLPIVPLRIQIGIFNLRRQRHIILRVVGRLQLRRQRGPPLPPCYYPFTVKYGVKKPICAKIRSIPAILQ